MYHQLTLTEYAGLPTGAHARLEMRYLALLRDGIDLPMGSAYKPVEATSVCATATVGGRAVLSVERECTCGAVFACSATSTPSRISIDFRFDPSSPQICDDCYPTRAVCTYPSLPKNSRTALLVNGKPHGELSRNAHGAWTAGQCPAP